MMKLIVFSNLLVFLVLAEIPKFNYGSFIERAKNFADDARSSLKKFGGPKSPFCTELGIDRISLDEQKFNNGNKCFRKYSGAPFENHNSSRGNHQDANYVYSKEEISCFLDQEEIFHENIKDAKIEAIAGYTTDCINFIEFIYGSRHPSSCENKDLRDLVIKMATDCAYMESAIEALRYDHQIDDYDMNLSLNIRTCVANGRLEVKFLRQDVMRKFRSCKITMKFDLECLDYSQKCFSVNDISRARDGMILCTKDITQNYRKNVNNVKRKVEKCVRISLVNMSLMSRNK